MHLYFKKVTCFSFLITSLVATSCSKEDVVDADPISSRFGEYIQIPDYIPTTNLATNLIATDNGLYFGVSSTDEEEDDESVYRYTLVQNDILKGSWDFYKHDGGFHYFRPLNMKSELLGNKEVLIAPWSFVNKVSVYKIANIVSGKIVEEIKAPMHDFTYANGGTYTSLGKIIQDGIGGDWAYFQGETVKDDNIHIIKRKNGNSYVTECKIIAKGKLLYSGSNYGGLYAIAPEEKKLFVIKPQSGYTSYDLSAYYDAKWDLYSYKNKFRFSNDATFFQYQDKILKLNEGNNTLSLFYTIKTIYAGAQAGDFCVDNDYLFTTDGTRKELNKFQSEVNIIPSMPSTANQEILLDHIDRTTVFQTGELETSTDPDDEYIYVLDPLKGRILVISKHYI